MCYTIIILIKELIMKKITKGIRLPQGLIKKLESKKDEYGFSTFSAFVLWILTKFFQPKKED